ncbi:hypothetical protein LAZ40_03235 [Cereibacter sphaeroides]|uniref:hypothetical protein n=1 Tax=Cereibacter sphaeroides TaxID=1063 RepID=UPI001F1A5AC7|nr:hypothetical protein [Cereibacter sphaeroides]MCE6958069.1 hypothetical protein [Cereibacter sphaeroides]MCE6971320.1 hypothetical protein [Cereibacter sphaeroides]
MRHPPIEKLYADDLASPFSSILRAWIRANEGWDKPAPVHLPNGAIVQRRIEEDQESAQPWMGLHAASIRHRGKRFWVSGLPLSPDEPHRIILAAFEPEVLLGLPAAEERPVPGVSVQLLTRSQTAMILGKMKLPEGTDPDRLVRTCVKTGRARVRAANGRTVVLELVTEPGANGRRKATDLVRVSLWPRRGVKPGIVFGSPVFEDVAQVTLKDGLKSRGIAVRVPQLDRVGKCMFVGENDIHYLRLGFDARCQAVDFGFIADQQPADAYHAAAVATYRDIRSRLTGGRRLNEVSRRPVTEEDRAWARDRLPVLFEGIRSATCYQGSTQSLVHGWDNARSDIAAGRDLYGMGLFGGAGVDATRRVLADPDLVADLDRFVTFWPRERADLVEEAVRSVSDRAPLEASDFEP